MKKHSKFSAVIPVVGVLTIGSILPLTSYAAETNKLPHSQSSLKTSMHAKAGTDTNTTPNIKTNPKVSSSADTTTKPDTSTTPNIKTKSETSFSADINAKIIRNGKISQLNTTENTSDYYPQPNKNPYVDPAQSIVTQTKYADVKDSDFINLVDLGTFGGVLPLGGVGIQNNEIITYNSSKKIQNLKSLPSNVMEGTKFKEEIVWELKHNQLEPKTLPHTWSIAEIHGVAKTNYQELGFSLGLDWSPIKDILKLSGAVTGKFGSSTTITDQITETKTDQFPAKPDTYPYNDYRVAVYQKTVRYSVVPGQKLKDALKDVFGSNPSSDEINVTVYKADELRPIVTPDNPK
ncbi:TPA: hypothetical protein QCR18_005679 [Bacillus cereus]|nr:hypothetical protein [Bacillus cereus]